MLRFYALSALYGVLVVCIFFTDLATIYRIGGGIAASLLYIGILAWASAKVHSQVYVKTFCRNKKKHDQVALTFDDGPDAELTPQLISLLDEYGARATFFLVGNKIEKNAALVKKLYLHGHSVGNHSFSHAHSFPMKLPKEIADDVQKTQTVLQETLGVRNVLFRPPFGVTNPLIARGIKRLGLVSVGWSIRSLDTVKTKEETVARVLRSVKGGDVILLHDTTKDIVWITREIVTYLKDNGLQPVTVHELMSKNNCK